MSSLKRLTYHAWASPPPESWKIDASHTQTRWKDSWVEPRWASLEAEPGAGCYSDQPVVSENGGGSTIWECSLGDYLRWCALAATATLFLQSLRLCLGAHGSFTFAAEWHLAREPRVEAAIKHGWNMQSLGCLLWVGSSGGRTACSIQNSFPPQINSREWRTFSFHFVAAVSRHFVQGGIIWHFNAPHYTNFIFPSFSFVFVFYIVHQNVPGSLSCTINY